MEHDDLKAAWQALDHRLAQQNRIQFALLRERGMDKARDSLRPLFWGQALQILLGIGMVVLGTACWNRNLHASGYLLAGIVVHLYGVACIALAGITMGLIGGLDYSAPVLKIQKQLTLLRKFYAFGGTAVGLPWWIMWIVVVIAVAGLGSPQPQNGTPPWVWFSLGVGTLGMLATWGAYRWARYSGRERLATWFQETATGASLRKAQARLDEVREFECE
ncbi:MAG TPA: hypothetical protein VFF96_07915 [Pseudoxanthomonas sp.]|nr:hypothetical protein [Pseudoxanthomonas sp.]